MLNVKHIYNVSSYIHIYLRIYLKFVHFIPFSVYNFNHSKYRHIYMMAIYINHMFRWIQDFSSLYIIGKQKLSAYISIYKWLGDERNETAMIKK